MRFVCNQSKGFICEEDLLKGLNGFFNRDEKNIFIESTLLRNENIMVFCYRNSEKPWIEIMTYKKSIMNIAFHEIDYNKFVELFNYKTEYDEETRRYINRIIEFIYSVYDKHISLQQYQNMNQIRTSGIIPWDIISIDILKDTDYSKVCERAASLIKTHDVILDFTVNASLILSIRLYKNTNNKILMEFTIKNANTDVFKWDRQKIYDLIRETLNLTVPVTSSIVTILGSIYNACLKEIKKLDSLEYTPFSTNAVYAAIKSCGKVEWEVCNNARILLKPFGKGYIITGYINGSHMYSDTIPGYLLTNKHIDANYHIYTRVIMALDYIYDQQHMIIGKNNNSVKEIAVDFGI